MQKRVALRKESVDRNAGWRHLGGRPGRVALRKESVDRNTRIPESAFKELVSLSARRAWIEIMVLMLHLMFQNRRSPQGERG